MFKKRLLICVLLALSLCFGMLAGCRDKTVVIDSPPTETADETVTPSPVLRDDELFDLLLGELFAKEVTDDSISLNYYVANPANFGIEPPAPSFGDVMTPEVIARTREENKELSGRLNGFRYEDLRTDQQIIYDILIRNLDLFEAMDKKEDYSYYLGYIYPVSGAQVQLPVLLAEFNFRTVQDIETYLQLLADTQRYFREMVEFERERSRRGFFMSDANADEVIANCESFLENREDNLLIVIFNDRIDQYEGLDSGQREDFKQRNKELILNNVLPAYDELLVAISELRGIGANQNGLASLPDGVDFAAAYLQYITGSDKTPEQVDALLKEGIDSVTSLIRALLTANPALAQMYYDGELGSIREQKPEIYLKMLEKAIKRYFPAIKPVQYAVREVHESLQKFLSPAFYLVPALDSYYDNVIYINPSQISDNLSLFTTLAHEGYPGHLYQHVYYFQQSPDPLRSLLSTTGYTEGWATYVEMHSYYYAGLDETEAKLMMLSHMYNLLLLSRADLGLNALGWKPIELASFLQIQGITDQAVIDNVTQMVTADPLSYLPYCLGRIEFESLREEAERETGDAFELKEFHRFLLEIGPAPFDLIRAHMQDWIKEQTAGALAPAA